MGSLEAFLNAGSLIGGLSCSYIFNSTGYSTIYSLSAGCILIAWLYMMLIVPESVSNIEKKGHLSNLFTISLLKVAMKTTFRKRANYGRCLILIIILLRVLFYVSYMAESYVVYLFVREKFHWALQQFNIYSAINNILWIVGNIVGSYLLYQFLRMKEIYIMLGGFLCYTLGSIWQGVAFESWHVYAGGCSKWFAGGVSPMSRVILSKAIPVEESGTIMALLTSLETLGLLCVAPIYTWIYNGTLSIYPGAFNFFTALLCVVNFILTILIAVILRHQNVIKMEMLEVKSNS